MDFSGVAGSLMKWNAIPCWLEMQTLGCKLLEAAPHTFVVTSDHPVVMMNQLFASSEPHRSFVGFSRSGFQLLLPISPTLCVFFYDPFVYKVGARRRRLVQLSPSDVELVIDALPEAWGDRALLGDVLANLLGNALKYSREREKARISVTGAARVGLAELAAVDGARAGANVT